MPFKPGINRNIVPILDAPYPFDVVDKNRRNAVEKFGKDYIIDFGIGDPTDPTPDVVRSACKKAVEDRKASGYPDTPGHAGFKGAVVEYVKKRFKVSLKPEEVVATYGAKYASSKIPLYFLNSGDVALIPNPSYPPYTSGTIHAGGVPYYLNILESNDFLPDFQSVPKDVLKKARLLFLNSPHSPTGTVYPNEKMREAVDLCRENDIILVSDECYADLYYDKPPQSILEVSGADECSIVLNSLSKRSMMTGYAVGFYASKNPELLKPYDRMERKSIQGVATFIQDAAAAAFKDEKHPEEMRGVYRQRLETLLPALRKVGCEVRKPGGTFFVWAKVPAGTTPLKFSENILLEKGINCVPGNIISHTFNGVNPGEKYVRFALVPPIGKVREAVERLIKG
ncbi:MAG: aminotransferase class I/II-fold pyridoxal phosphate-dependent enzyme [Candidatus Altiarchaeota archaeon]|nr:aminotransferase class I/II-fold pyridoxal phosphate-dependent enzyme [Candidatus Altiarchaeota archaeon]